MHPKSGFRMAPSWPKIGKMTMTSQFVDVTSSSIFWRCFVSLVNFSYWSSFMSISSLVLELWYFLLKGINQKSGNRKYPGWVLHNIWRLGQVRGTKFGKDVSIEMLLNTAKCEGYSFYHFWVNKGKPTGGKITPCHPD